MFAKSCESVHSFPPFTAWFPNTFELCQLAHSALQWQSPEPSPFPKTSIFCSLVATFKCRESLGNDLIIWCWFLEVRYYLGSSSAFSLWHNGNVFPLFSWANCFHESYCSYYINWAHGETEGSHIQWFELGSVWMGQHRWGEESLIKVFWL